MILTHRVFETLDQAWTVILNDVLMAGDDVRPRGMLTRELLHVSFSLRHPRFNLLINPERKLSYHYAVAEWLWILLGRQDVATIAPYNKNLGRFSDDGKTFFGAYGPWVAQQLPYVINTIKADPDTRQAVITIWQQSPPKTKDVPCTVALQYLLRRGRLHAQTFMRSNDAWLGLPYDVWTFTQLQAYVAAALGVPVGRYTHTAGPLHLYEEHFEAAARAATFERWGRAVNAPDLTYPYPIGLPAVFEDLPLRPSRAFDLPWVWGTYAGVLAHKLTKDRTFLRRPFDDLIPDAPAVPAIREGEQP